MWDDQDLLKVKHSSSLPNVCGGEDPIDKSEQISSPPKEFVGTYQSKEVKHSSLTPNV